MEITYSLTPQDVQAFQQFHTAGRGKWRWLNTAVRLFLLGVWAMQLLFLVRAIFFWHEFLGSGLLIWRILFLSHQHLFTSFGLTTLYLVYIFWGAQRLIRLRTPDPALLAQPRTVRLAPEGVTVSSPSENLRRPWAEINTVESDRSSLYLYIGPANAIVIPRRAFADRRAAQEFESQARAFRADPRLTAAPPLSQESPSAEGVWPPPPVYAPSAASVSEDIDPLLTPMPGTVEAVYKTRPADLWRTQVRIFSRRPALLLPPMVPYALAAAVWTFPRMAPLPALGLALAIGAAGTLVTVLLTTQAAITKRFAKFKDGRPCRTVARPDFLCDITPEGRTTLRWPLVAKIEVRNGDVLVQTCAGGGLIVPRSAFAGQQERTAFVDALRRFHDAGQSTSS